MSPSPPVLTDAEILRRRRRVGALDRRLPAGAEALHRAVWAGLQDSMPRAALLAMHARVEETAPDAWEDASLVQVWGPRFSVFVVGERDAALFTLARLPADERRRARAEEIARRFGERFGDARVSHAEAERALDLPPNALRLAAVTGTIRIRWDGSRQPTVWRVPRPAGEALSLRAELARRYLHVYGPSTTAAFARWAGIDGGDACAAMDALGTSVTRVRTPLGEALLMTDDLDLAASAGVDEAPARFLPSGDPYTLLQGSERGRLVPDAVRQAALWPSRVWPGALLVRGELVGTWRRDAGVVTVTPWRRLSRPEQDGVEAEAQTLPLPGLNPGERTLVWREVR